jgi:hypothetical protein
LIEVEENSDKTISEHLDRIGIKEEVAMTDTLFNLVFKTVSGQKPTQNQ